MEQKAFPNFIYDVLALLGPVDIFIRWEVLCERSPLFKLLFQIKQSNYVLIYLFCFNLIERYLYWIFVTSGVYVSLINAICPNNTWELIGNVSIIGGKCTYDHWVAYYITTVCSLLDYALSVVYDFSYTFVLLFISICVILNTY